MTEREFPSEMPVFPLPHVVLFPQTTLPLHIFEPRYRRMVEDVLSGDRWIAVSLLREGTDPTGVVPPPFHELAGLGYLVRSARLPGGEYNIMLQGKVRARLREIPSSHPYRMVQVEPLYETTSWLREREGARLLGKILREAGRTGLIDSTAARKRMPRSAEERSALVNLLASSVLADSSERQAMLNAELPDRARLLLRQLGIATDLLDALKRFPRPSDPRHN
jgi:Lon protease-like protein